MNATEPITIKDVKWTVKGRGVYRREFYEVFIEESWVMELSLTPTLSKPAIFWLKKILNTDRYPVTYNLKGVTLKRKDLPSNCEGIKIRRLYYGRKNNTETPPQN